MNASAQIVSRGDGRYLSSAIGYWTGKEEEELGEHKGQWLGGLASSLNLEGEIERNDSRLDLLVLGRDPNTGEILRKGATTTRTYIDKETGETKEYNPTNGIDITFSAPKDFSLLTFLSPKEQREKLEAIHREAVLKAFEKIQENAYRRDSNGIHKADIIAGAFEHTTSREQDPQLHTHIFTANISKSEDGKTGALDIKKLLGGGALLEYGAIYKAELQHGLLELGFETKTVLLEKGTSFQITNVGFTDELRTNFSKRSEQIKADQEEHPEHSKQQSTLITRKAKEELVNREACFRRWKSEAEKLGYDLEKLKVQAKEREPDEQTKEQELKQKVLQNLQRKEAFSAITKKDVESRFLSLGAGQFNYAKSQTLAKKFMKEHLHEIGSESDRWKRGAIHERPLHLKLRRNADRSNVLKHEIKLRFSPKYQQRVSAVYERRTAQREKDENKARLYTLNQASRSTIERDSAYSIIRSKLSTPLQKLLPSGRPLSYQYKQKQYAKSKAKFLKRQKSFKRKMFFAYMTGRISRKQYVQIRDGKGKPKTKLGANAKWLFTNKLSKRQRDYLIRKIDQQKEKEKKTDRKPEIPRFSKPKTQEKGRDR